MNVSDLREFLRPIAGSFKDSSTNAEMPNFCATIGLPHPPEAMSKRERLEGAFDLLADEDIHSFGQLLVDQGRVTGEARNALQELLWAGRPWPEVSKRLRREIARTVHQLGLYRDGKRFDSLLDGLFVIGGDVVAEIFGGRPNRGLRYQIQQHVHRNPDWNAEKLFDELGAFAISDRRFALLLEGLASAEVRIDAEDQHAFVEGLNPVLKGSGLELRETRTDGGYPVFELLSLHASRGRPKNLIFASQIKPDIIVRDTLDNDIEILSHADAILVYDRPIESDGLRWRDLQQWWAETNNIGTPKVAKASLYRRLLECLPESSPPQRALFEAYYAGFGAQVPGLPALLPEVWLHWDPKTVRERGVNALLNQRMDFLLLLPGGIRVVVEVDGQQHYADNGKASPQRYAKMAAGDRDLKLARYEVFRFGATELQTATAAADVKTFFEALFARFGVR
jgi:hypothetical protein